MSASLDGSKDNVLWKPLTDPKVAVVAVAPLAYACR